MDPAVGWVASPSSLAAKFQFVERTSRMCLDLASWEAGMKQVLA